MGFSWKQMLVILLIAIAAVYASKKGVFASFGL